MVGLVTASIVVAAGSAYMQHRAGKKATRAQEAANEAQRQINRLRNKQAKRQYLRQFRQAQAAVYTSAVSQGIGLGGSTVQGQRASHQAQRQTALTEFRRMDELGGEMTAAMNAASQAQFQGQTWGAVGSFAQRFITAEGMSNLMSGGSSGGGGGE